MNGTADKPDLDWWSTNLFIALMALAFALPLVWPSIPPLTDLMGHMGRYRVELDIGRSPFLSRYFDYHWAPIGNLGVDLLVVPLSRLFGLELAVKLIVLAIPPLTAGGMLLLAREIHGRVPPTALFALPLAYAYPFQFGFVNFTLAIALAFPALALWVRLGRMERFRLRAGLFAPISFALFFAHSVGWGMFGLAAFAIEAAARHGRGTGWIESGWRAGLACLPLAPPILLMADWWLYRSTGAAARFWQWDAKIYHALTVLRNASRHFDLLSAVLLYLMLVLGLRRIGLRFDAKLGLAALILLAVYLVMPGIVMGSAYADMRLAAYTLAVAILALTPLSANRATRSAIAMAGLVFVAARLGVQGWTYWRLDRGYHAQLAALDHIPEGARIVALSNVPCQDIWDAPRTDHLGMMALVRRDAFVNGQWPQPGGRLLSVKYKAGGDFTLDPSQMLQPRPCRQKGSFTLGEALARIPRPAFDYLWLINVPHDRWPRDRNFVPAWQGERGVLYRISERPAITVAAGNAEAHKAHGARSLVRR